MTAIKIDRAVPLPSKRGKWPFAALKVGESFTVPLMQAPSMRATAAVTGKRLKKHFTVRREGDNFRCWRDK
jgi:hypothetical protein